MTLPVQEQLFLGRQPILDRDQQLVAYELLFRNSQQNAADVVDGTQATATVIANAFTELSVGDALGNCLGFINVDESFLFSDVLELLPKEQVVLEILETVRPTPEVFARARELKSRGFMLALDDVTQVSDDYQELVKLVDIIKVDLQPLSPEQLTQLTQGLLPLKKQLLAEKVDSQEQMDQCMELGFSLFQGYFFAKPQIIEGKKLSPSQISLMKLVGLVMSDADTADLEAAFKTEPALTVNLLRLTNSVGAGSRTRITSLRHAITILGQRQLQRWLQLLLFASGSKAGTASPLLQLAATRARAMELLALELKRADTSFADQAFMVGIMSLVPALMGVPMGEVIKSLTMGLSTREALLEGKGQLGKLLELVAASERRDIATMKACLPHLPGLTPAAFNAALTKALAWANSITREGA